VDAIDIYILSFFCRHTTFFIKQTNVISSFISAGCFFAYNERHICLNIHALFSSTSFCYYKGLLICEMFEFWRAQSCSKTLPSQTCFLTFTFLKHIYLLLYYLVLVPFEICFQLSSISTRIDSVCVSKKVPITSKTRVSIMPKIIW